MPSVSQGGRHRKAQAFPLPSMVRGKTGNPRGFQKLGAESENFKEWKWQSGIVAHTLCDSQWNRGRLSMKKWESEKHKSWSIAAEGFKGHVATDGSLLVSKRLGSGAVGL